MAVHGDGITFWNLKLYMSSFFLHSALLLLAYQHPSLALQIVV